MALAKLSELLSSVKDNSYAIGSFNVSNMEMAMGAIKAAEKMQAPIIIQIAGLIPKFSSVLTTIPYCVLGGATVSVFASIAMTGMKLITTEPMDFRNTTVVGLAVAVGMGVTQANASLAQFPEWVTTIFGKSPVVLATIVAIVLNLTLPRTQKKAEK